MENCIYNGQEYSQGSVTCQNGNEFVCDNGYWNRTGAHCSEEIKTFTTLSFVSNSEIKNFFIETVDRCVNFVPGSYPGTTIPLYNKCDESKKVRIFWLDGSDSTDYCINGRSSLWINTKGKSGSIIDEMPC